MEFSSTTHETYWQHWQEVNDMRCGKRRQKADMDVLYVRDLWACGGLPRRLKEGSGVCNCTVDVARNGRRCSVEWPYACPVLNDESHRVVFCFTMQARGVVLGRK